MGPAERANEHRARMALEAGNTRAVQDEGASEKERMRYCPAVVLALREAAQERMTTRPSCGGLEGLKGASRMHGKATVTRRPTHASKRPTVSLCVTQIGHHM